MRPHRTSVLRLAPAALLAATLASPAVLATEPAAPAPGAATTAPKPAPVATDVGSYDVGLLMGGQLDHNGLGQKELDVEALLKGVREALSGRALTADERDAAGRFMRDARASLAGKNQAVARTFLEKNAKEPGIVSMPSGLQYRILNAGDANGTSPRPTDTVTVRYRASFADGTEFDRSETHGMPATFRVNTVFKGWQEAFQMMKPGATWQLFVPPDLGYGANSPPIVPPGSLLVYEIELLRVETTKSIDATTPVKVRPSAPAPAKPKATPPATPH